MTSGFISPTTVLSTVLVSGEQPSSNNFGSSLSNVALYSQPRQLSSSNALFGAQISTSDSAGGEIKTLDVEDTEEDEMEEAPPETSNTNELNLKNLGGFGIG